MSIQTPDRRVAGAGIVWQLAVTWLIAGVAWSSVAFAETVRFERPDGAVLVGTFEAAGDHEGPAVLLLHQAGSSSEEFDFLLPGLHEMGLHTLSLDLRGHGKSSKPDKLDRAFFSKLFTDPDYAPPDIEVALEWLAAREKVDPKRIGIIGGSVGANLAYMAAGAGWRVKTAVVLSGNAKNANLLATRIDAFDPRSVFLLAADGDHGRDQFARQMYEQAGKPRRIEILAGSSAHGVSILAESEDLRLAVFAWLRAQLFPAKD